MEILTSFAINFNYFEFKKLYEKTGFNLSNKLYESLYYNPHKKFSIEDTNFALRYRNNLNVSECNCSIDIFVDTDATDEFLDKLQIDHNLQRQIYNNIILFVEELNEKLNEIQIPIDNLENIIYNEKTNKFYVEMISTMPNIINISCEINKRIDEFNWKPIN